MPSRYFSLNSVQTFTLSFRMDEDQSARKNAQLYLKAPDPDYYLLEGLLWFFFPFLVPTGTLLGK